MLTLNPETKRANVEQLINFAKTEDTKHKDSICKKF